MLAVFSAMRQAVERARQGEGSTLIEAKVFRLVPHSSDDDQKRYRSPAEIEEAEANDPIPRFQAYLEERGFLTGPQNDEINKRVAAEVDDATDYAEASPPPSPEDALTHVYGS